MDTETVFEEQFGAAPTAVVRAPGRTNLIGEHIDYSGGHVMPFAIGCAVEVAAAPRKDGFYRFYSVQYRETYEGALPQAKLAEPFWPNYVFGVLHEFKRLGHDCPGLDLVIDGDIPQGSGLSSSAALEVAAAWALQALLATELSRIELAQLGQRAENGFVGMNCGIMDQAISACGQANHALLLDCNSLESRQIPLDLRGEYAILVAHSGVHRGLSGSAYNQRRAKCEAALDVLREETGKDLPCLCAATLEDLAKAQGAMDEEMLKRARHAIGEEARVCQAARALAEGDFATVGDLLNASHASLRDDYEVSCSELDALTDRIRSLPGALGSRLTGAGFGGCTVSLVETAAAEVILDDLRRNYYAPQGFKPIAFVTNAEEGVRTL